ncbi:hypothetical protein RB195_012016 [Necator americanus]
MNKCSITSENVGDGANESSLGRNELFYYAKAKRYRWGSSTINREKTIPRKRYPPLPAPSESTRQVLQKLDKLKVAA